MPLYLVYKRSWYTTWTIPGTATAPKDVSLTFECLESGELLERARASASESK